MEKFSIIEVFSRGFNDFKNNWKVLVSMQLMITVFSFVFEILKKPENFGLGFIRFNGYGFVSFIILLISMYIMTRLGLTQIIMSNQAISKGEVSFSSSYEDAGNGTWRLIGFNILVGIVMAIFLFISIFFIIFSVLENSSSPYTIFGLVFLVMLPLFLFQAKLYFAAYAAALKPKAVGLFEYTWNVTKNHYFKVLFMILVPMLLYLPIVFSSFNELKNTIAIEFYEFNNVSFWAVALIVSVVELFLQPVIVLSFLHAMREMEIFNKMVRGDEFEELIPPTE